MHIIDWYPTLINLAGGKINQTTTVDGKDVWPMITQNQKSPHDAILTVSTRGPVISAIRIDNWKLILLAADTSQLKTKAFNKYESVALFNLLDDPSETKNLALKYPERVILMQKRLNEMLKDAVPSRAKDAAEELQ